MARWAKAGKKPANPAEQVSNDLAEIVIETVHLHAKAPLLFGDALQPQVQFVLMAGQRTLLALA